MTFKSYFSVYSVIFCLITVRCRVRIHTRILRKLTLLSNTGTGKSGETCLDGSGMFRKLGDSFYNSMLLITSAPQAIPMQGPLVSQARWPMVYFVSFLFIGRVLLFKLITVSSMQIFKFTIEDAYLKRLSHRKRSARISFQMLKQDNVSAT